MINHSVGQPYLSYDVSHLSEHGIVNPLTAESIMYASTYTRLHTGENEIAYGVAKRRWWEIHEGRIREELIRASFRTYELFKRCNSSRIPTDYLTRAPIIRRYYVNSESRKKSNCSGLLWLNVRDLFLLANTHACMSYTR